MAQFTKVNGDFKPVLHLDSAAYSNTGLNAVTSGASVQPQGPKLDFFTVTATGHLTGAQVLTITQILQQLSVLYIYEFTTGGSNDTFAVASYPIGAWTTTAIDTALTAAGVTGTTTTATATFTN